MWILPKNYPLSSRFAQDMVESKEDLTLLGLNIESSLMWRSKPSPLRTWLTRWKTDSYLPHLFTRILKPSLRTSFEAALISSLAATRASRFQQQGSALAPKTQDTSGPTSSTTSMQLDLFDAFSRTSRDTSALDSEKSSKTWKDLVMQRRGEYSARLKSERLIKGKGSTSWLTPRASDTGRGEKNETFTKRMGDRTGNVYQSLPSQVHAREAKHNLWPTSWATPRTTDAQGGGRPLNEKGQRITLIDPTKTYGGNLSDQVRHWPTPAARDYKDFGPNVDYQKVAAKSKLAGVVMINQQDYPAQQSGSLNPDWVEWLMGVPIGWTDLGYWGTE